MRIFVGQKIVRTDLVSMGVMVRWKKAIIVVMLRIVTSVFSHLRKDVMYQVFMIGYQHMIMNSAKFGKKLKFVFCSWQRIFFEENKAE